MLDRISSTETELDKLGARRELLEERIRVCETQIKVSGQLIDQLLEGGYKDGLRREVKETHERRAHTGGVVRTDRLYEFHRETY
jgi:hypothetical protein